MRRGKIGDLVDRLSTIRRAVVELKEAEQKTLNSMPEGMHSSVRRELMEGILKFWRTPKKGS